MPNGTGTTATGPTGHGDSAGETAAIDSVASRYLLIGDTAYRRSDGSTVTPVYATRTAKLLFVDPSVARRLRTGQISEIDSADLSELVDAKAVVPADEDERGAVVSRFKRFSDNRAYRRFTLMPTSNCNMGCSYCGQEHYKPVPKESRLGLVAERVLAAIAEPEVRSVFVTWFGGEPLLALRTIRELSTKFIASAREHGTAYRANMATNGSLLTMRTMHRLYDDCLLRSMDVTIDGPQEQHDARRFLKNGGRSFRRILTVLGEAAESGAFPDLTVNIRVNIDNANQDHVSELLDELAAAGFTDRLFRVQLFPVHSWGNDVSAVELGKRAYADREAEWLAQATRSGLHTELLPQQPRHGTCLATTRNAELIDAEGRMYGCSEHPLVPGESSTKVIARLDSLSPGAIRPRAEFDHWYQSVDEGGPQCSSCPVLPVCGGACPKLWQEGHVPCPSIKSNWRQRLDLAAIAHGLVPEGALR
ncbi:radical SAM/SPASM domain-containing protein [Catellatospora sp. TT07R-123]|uniref:radical SAM/SPASM domain-containing protein n=1 Tax=Catellatospora sp. TT07R-123 TaxID=2733863 RepID=UPI001B06CC71|nr:radical SAM protein [Catellatospora sp. TT07R-123]GHJ50626.1 radical SAM/SPASM domain-containing protein [Catellatospora sp. TT07R-123]